jgi:hypothetical protein
MNDARFRKILRSALAVSMASPAIGIAASCGGSVDSVAPADDAGTSPTPTTTTTPTGTSTGNPPPPPPPNPDASSDGGDAGQEAGCRPEAKLPKDDVCSKYQQLPCDVPEDAGSFSQQECAKMCPTEDGGGAGSAYWCHVQREPDGGPYLACQYCVIGRRPEGLAPAPRAVGSFLGAFFADASHLEAASIDAFRALREELAAVGAPAALLARAERARRDEVRHARMTARLARRFGAEPGAWSLPPRVEERRERSLEAIALENAVEGCVRETFGALAGLWQAEHATEPAVRAAMRAIAADELRHAALAWSVATWLRPRLDEAGRARIDAAQREAIEALARELDDEPDRELRVRAGLPSAGAARRLLSALDAELWSAELS